MEGEAEISFKLKEKSWREEDGVTYLAPLTSDGTSGPDWIKRLEKQGKKLTKRAKDLLNSPDFKPTSGVTYHVAVLTGKLFNDEDRSMKNIRAEADKRKLLKPNAELACLIREKYSDDDLKAMGLLWIVVFHDPIKDSDEDLHLLSASRGDDDSFLDTYYGYPGFRWIDVGGFAFVVSQVQG